MVKRTRRHNSPSSKGLAAGEILKRETLAGNFTSNWGWVGAEVTNSSDISHEHCLTSCGLSARSSHPFCRNQRASSDATKSEPSRRATPQAQGELEDDAIVISDDEGHPVCSKKSCKSNPNCLNYLGQDQWEDETRIQERFRKLAKLGDNPLLDARDPDHPVGLKNLGATCYANASLQVWFRNLAFRAGVYSCRPLDGAEDKFMDSPLFQMQVTFAALQDSSESFFNPSKLVESLQLRTTEQQDAQEFSKLFMTHLDAEFKKQPDPAVKYLINNQYEGKQVYCTQCHNCQYKSERTSDFLEIEINFLNNSKLEDCLRDLLQPETLTGDNQYFCSQCNSLQDAMRYTELQELPPVLNFSLLRFVYDLKTMERKKSKNTIIFPRVLRMSRFVGSSFEREATTALESEDRIYELRGILLHKGSSAYHGHYEAQVFDETTRSWYQFNDEYVTRIGNLGDRRTTKAEVDIEETEDKGDDMKSSGSKRKKQASGSRKRQRVDSDDENTESRASSQSDCSSDISSKNAYMLVYNLREPPPAARTELLPEPPVCAKRVVNELNAIHDRECDLYAKREKALQESVNALTWRVQDIYRSWNVSSTEEDCVIVSRQALEMWLSTHSLERLLPQTAISQEDGARERTLIPTNDILCEHGRLDHRKAGQFKRITRDAYAKITDYTNCVITPALSLNDICDICVETAFQARLYQIEHPRLVNEVLRLLDEDDDRVGFWISKAWLKDWCLQKPKMHVPSESDPPPDAPEFERHVRCEHGDLSLGNTARRRISAAACEVLTTIFPDWKPVSTDQEICSVCEALLHEHKLGNLEHRKRAEEEKAKLKHMYEYAFGGITFFLESVPCTLISFSFLHCWRQWLSKPTEYPRPEVVDNAVLFCEHDMLTIDPNCPADLESTAAIIKRTDWDILETFYNAGPLISVNISSDKDENRLLVDVPICADCRYTRRLNWEITDITIVVMGEQSKQAASASATQRTYSRKRGGARQSRRLRQVRENGRKQKLTVSKTMSVKEIKIAIHEELNIPTICQRLFLHGQELDDNEATVASLQFLANDVLELHEESEVHELSDSDEVPAAKRKEGRGFSGTLLGGASQRSPTPATTHKSTEKYCIACTFANPVTAKSCNMCDTTFM